MSKNTWDKLLQPVHTCYVLYGMYVMKVILSIKGIDIKNQLFYKKSFQVRARKYCTIALYRSNKNSHR